MARRRSAEEPGRRAASLTHSFASARPAGAGAAPGGGTDEDPETAVGALAEAGVTSRGGCHSCDLEATSECRTESRRPAGAGVGAASGCPLRSFAARRERSPPDQQEEEGGASSWSSVPHPWVAAAAVVAAAVDAMIVAPLGRSSGERRVAPCAASAASVIAAVRKAG